MRVISSHYYFYLYEKILNRNNGVRYRVGLMMEGTGINHAHIKLMPLHGTQSLKKGAWKQFLSGKRFWFDKYEGWISSGGGALADPQKLKKLADRIKNKKK
jgi:hypothetical protein